MDTNLCFLDIINATQNKKNHCEYTIGNMVGITDKGKHRDYQQDAILMAQKNDISLMAVADGVGGAFRSELASNYIALLLGLWFNEKKFTYGMNIDDLISEIIELIINASYKMMDEHYGATTLAMALRLYEDTIAFNVGDSRVYKYDGRLEQMFADQSEAWISYLKGYPEKKDYLRFYKENNIITSCLGDDDPIIDRKVIANNYDYLMLCSDGVSDLVPDYDIEKILKDSENNKAHRIINQALTVDIHQDYLCEDFYYNDIKAGKDNASIVLYKAKK